jgi:hypothetical protein
MHGQQNIKSQKSKDVSWHQIWTFMNTIVGNFCNQKRWSPGRNGVLKKSYTNVNALHYVTDSVPSAIQIEKRCIIRQDEDVSHLHSVQVPGGNKNSSITQREERVWWRQCWGTAATAVRCLVQHVWNVIAHAQKPDLVFQRNRRDHLNRRGCQFSLLLAVEECGSAGRQWTDRIPRHSARVVAILSNRLFPLHFPPPMRRGVPSRFERPVPKLVSSAGVHFCYWFVIH